MNILDTLHSPWAIEPGKYAEICDVYARHLKGDKIDIKAVEERLGHPLQNIHNTEIFGNVAVLPIHGVLAKKANLMQKVSGGSSMELISKEFNALMESDQIDTIILDVDSPGGTVTGTELLGELIYEARGQGKKIVAVANELMASAAYWVASAADEVYASSSTAVVGSIGVVTEHTDASGLNEKEGISKTVIHAGKFKAVGHSNAPLSDSDKGVIQEQLDYTYSIFVNTVARNRGADAETVLADMADGRTFMGEQAVSAGLVDGVATLDSLIAKYSSNVFNNEETTNIIDYLENDTEEYANMPTMNEAYLADNHSELLATIKQGAIDSLDLEAVKAEAAEAERERIASVLDLPMASANMDLVKSLAFDGKTTKAEAALALLESENGKREAISADLKAEGAELLDIEPSASSAENVETIEASNKADDWDNNEELRAEFGGDKDQYEAYMRATANGQVKLMSKKG